MRIDRSVMDLVAGDLVADGSIADLLGVAQAEVADGRPRIRPILVALAARAAGAARVEPEAQHAAEVLHLLLVAHDVAMGRTGGRRRQVARRLLRRLGTNALTVRALELARHASHPEILGEIVDALREISDAQALSEVDRAARVPPHELWRAHADGRSGAILAFCCRSGALLGGGEAPTVSALSRYGRHVGRMWTGAEDLLAFDANDLEFLVQRAASGRPVLPVALAARTDTSVGDAWSKLLLDPNPSAAVPVLGLAQRAGGHRAAREALARECWSAQRALAAVPSSVYRKGLEAVATSLARPEAET